MLKINTLVTEFTETLTFNYVHTFNHTDIFNLFDSRCKQTLTDAL